ncbi:fibrillin-1-like, partial [Elysia marginata]
IDECENSTLYSCPEFTSCVNLDGSYTCDCDAGFMRQGGVCEDIDECQNSTLFTCPSHSECVNLNGTYECQCESDYFKNEIGLCEEIEKESFKLRTCPCVCPALVTEVLKDLPDPKKSSDTIQKKLEVKSTNLATTVRKKISASDERGSSASFGIIALSLLALEFVLVTVGDFIMVVYYIKQKVAQLFCGNV